MSAAAVSTADLALWAKCRKCRSDVRFSSAPGSSSTTYACVNQKCRNRGGTKVLTGEQPEWVVSIWEGR